MQHFHGESAVDTEIESIVNWTRMKKELSRTFRMDFSLNGMNPCQGAEKS